MYIYILKVYISIWSKEDFVIKNVKNTVPWTYLTEDLNEKRLLETFAKTNYKKQIKKVLG